MVCPVIFGGRHTVGAGACDQKYQPNRHLELSFRQKTLRNLNLGIQVEAHKNPTFHFCIDAGLRERAQRRHTALRVYHKTGHESDHIDVETSFTFHFQFEGGVKQDINTESGRN